MSLDRCRVTSACCLIAALGLLSIAQSSDAAWPTYGGNFARTAFAEEPLPKDLHEIWRYKAPQPPRPAWPEPARGSYWQNLASMAPRVTDDHAFHPVIAGGKVFFGSSADDTVRALDLRSGELIWSYTCDGPVRYAPTVVGERVLFGADDGRVYCLNAGSGELQWSQLLAEKERVLPGNGRLISAWPVRTSIVVTGDTAHVFAGLFPSQGVWAISLKVSTGEVLRREAVTTSPQGYLLLDESNQLLVVPTGRGKPVAYSLKSGKSLGEVPSSGGSYALVADGNVLAGTGNNGSMLQSDAKEKRQLASFRAQRVAVTPDRTAYCISGEKVYAAAMPASAQKSLDIAWSQQYGPVHSVAATATCVVVGGERQLLLLEPDSGKLRKKLAVEGKVLGLAIAEGTIVAATDGGSLYAFSDQLPASPVSTRTASPATNGNNLALKELLPGYDRLEGPLSRRGYVVLAGAKNRELLNALIADTEFHITILETDNAAVRALRQELIAAGLYGARASVHQVSSERIPFVSRFANFVIDGGYLASGEPTDISAAELRRVLRPSGGCAWLAGGEQPWKRADLPKAGAWTHLYGSPANDVNSGDQLVSNNLRLQWFGGPGPSRMVDRHLRGPSPLVKSGQMIVPGEDRFICVDSFNGTELWELEVPGSQRYSTPYDCGYYTFDGEEFIVAAGEEAWFVDQSGQVEARQPLPAAAIPDGANCRWGYLAKHGESVLGSAMLTTAARLQPSRHQIDLDYNNQQPIVTSRSMFRLNSDGNLAWIYRGVIAHPTICMRGDLLWFVVADENMLRDHATGRVSLPVFLGADAKLVCLDVATGTKRYEVQLTRQLLASTNILYTLATETELIVLGSTIGNGDSQYSLAVYEAETGAARWQASHARGKRGQFGHGEQVHHPVVLGDKLLAEPALYRLSDGKRLDPEGTLNDWQLRRPGHGCGTVSACPEAIFFRAGNPSMMSLAGDASPGKIERLAPSRPGCWINIIPADGMVLIPEASASCVCLYSLQTSLALAPVEP